jgi:TolB-like protein/Flp pilus assembly protein TadD
MSFVNELKRRNVFRVGVAYAIVAWLLLQVADVVLNNIEAPGWVFQAILLLVAFGFPFALIFAWAFELTPQGLKKEKDIVPSDSVAHVTGRKLDFAIIGLLAIAVVFLVVDNYVLREDPAPLVSDQTEPAIQAEEKSIAVLPFVNMSDDPGNEYFADGLSEELLNLLAKIPSLKVIGRTSSFAFKGKNEDLRLIGEALGVTTVLEGSVRKSGERVRVTAQLINVSDGSHIWSDTYDRTLDDIFAIQDDVAAAIIGALQIHVGTNPTRGRPTDNTEAYALFFQARVLINAKDPAGAEEILLKAVELDPNFADAYELLAFSYWEQTGWLIPATDGKRLMGEAAAKALAIDPDLAFAHALHESASNNSWLRWIQGLERAAREEPGKTEVVEALVWDLLQVGYFQEALRFAERYADRDPLLPAANYWLANALYAVGRTTEADAAWELAAQLGHNLAKWLVGIANLFEKRDDIFIAQLEAWLQENGYPDSSWVRELVTGARDPATGQAYLDRRIPQIVASVQAEHAPGLQGILTDWYLYFGYLDRYFEIIFDIALDSTWDDALGPVWSGTVLRPTGFTAHPKYLAVAEYTGLIELWDQRGAPDFCEKVGGDWVCE